MLNFHTEYILDQAGRFLNEVDPVEVSENGIVNGASFNYGLARGRTHKDLDIDPVKAWDPAFRKHVLYQQDVRYLAPKNDRSVEGYWSRKGVFAQGGKSYKQQVAQRVRSFLRGILAYAGASSYRMDFIGFYSNGKEVADLFFHLSKRIDGFDCSVVIWFAVDIV